MCNAWWGILPRSGDDVNLLRVCINWYFFVCFSMYNVHIKCGLFFTLSEKAFPWLTSFICGHDNFLQVMKELVGGFTIWHIGWHLTINLIGMPLEFMIVCHCYLPKSCLQCIIWKKMRGCWNWALVRDIIDNSCIGGCLIILLETCTW